MDDLFGEEDLFQPPMLLMQGDLPADILTVTTERVDQGNCFGNNGISSSNSNSQPVSVVEVKDGDDNTSSVGQENGKTGEEGPVLGNVDAAVSKNGGDMGECMDGSRESNKISTIPPSKNLKSDSSAATPAPSLIESRGTLETSLRHDSSNFDKPENGLKILSKEKISENLTKDPENQKTELAENKLDPTSSTSETISSQSQVGVSTFLCSESKSIDSVVEKTPLTLAEPALEILSESAAVTDPDKPLLSMRMDKVIPSSSKPKDVSTKYAKEGGENSESVTKSDHVVQSSDAVATREETSLPLKTVAEKKVYLVPPAVDVSSEDVDVDVSFIPSMVTGGQESSFETAVCQKSSSLYLLGDFNGAPLADEHVSLSPPEPINQETCSPPIGILEEKNSSSLKETDQEVSTLLPVSNLSNSKAPDEETGLSPSITEAQEAYSSPLVAPDDDISSSPLIAAGEGTYSPPSFLFDQGMSSSPLKAVDQEVLSHLFEVNEGPSPPSSPSVTAEKETLYFPEVDNHKTSLTVVSKNDEPCASSSEMTQNKTSLCAMIVDEDESVSHSDLSKEETGALPTSTSSQSSNIVETDNESHSLASGSTDAKLMMTPVVRIKKLNLTPSPPPDAAQESAKAPSALENNKEAAIPNVCTKLGRPRKRKLKSPATPVMKTRSSSRQVHTPFQNNSTLDVSPPLSNTTTTTSLSRRRANSTKIRRLSLTSQGSPKATPEVVSKQDVLTPSVSRSEELNCSSSTASCSRLSTHLQPSHTTKYRCELCDKQFKNRWSLQAHQNILGVTCSLLTVVASMPTDTLIFYCYYCKKAFSQRMNLVTHIVNKHPFQHFTADQVFSTCLDENNEDPDVVIRYVHRDGRLMKRFSCVFCGSQRHQHRAMMKHVKEWHQEMLMKPRNIPLVSIKTEPNQESETKLGAMTLHPSTSTSGGAARVGDGGSSMICTHLHCCGFCGQRCGSLENLKLHTLAKHLDYLGVTLKEKKKKKNIHGITAASASVSRRTKKFRITDQKTGNSLQRITRSSMPQKRVSHRRKKA